MAHFIVDLDVIFKLELSLKRRLKPDEIIIVSYIKNFPKGYFGTTTKLGERFNIGRTRVYVILDYLLERKILTKENGKYLFVFNLNSIHNTNTSVH